MYMYVMHVLTYMIIYMYTCTHVYNSKYRYSRCSLQINFNLRIQTCTVNIYVYTVHVYMHTYVHTYIRTCMHAYIHAHICTFIVHTYICSSYVLPRCAAVDI